MSASVGEEYQMIEDEPSGLFVYRCNILQRPYIWTNTFYRNAWIIDFPWLQFIPSITFGFNSISLL